MCCKPETRAENPVGLCRLAFSSETMWEIVSRFCVFTNLLFREIRCREMVSTSSSYKGHKTALCSTTPYFLCSSYIYGTVPLPVPDVFMGRGSG